MTTKPQKSTIIKLLLVFIIYLMILPTSGFQDNKFLLGEPTTSEILRSRGYIAKDHYVKVQDNKYTLNLVRVTNPLINNGRSGLPDKDPILFIHGVILNAVGFFYINENVRPKNFSSHNVSSMSLDELNDLLEGEDGSKSLVFTALNFGHEVWLLNRRNVRESLMANNIFDNFIFPFREAMENNITLDRKDESEDKIFNLFGTKNNYWNYSLDEQAKYDIPETIDYILEKSKRNKLALVGHSAGSALILLTLTNYPEMADKVSKALLWAPALDLPFDYKNPAGLLLVALLPLISKIIGPFPPLFTRPFIESLVLVGCNVLGLKQLLCEPIFDLLGIGTSQWIIEELKPQNEWFHPIPYFELAQFVQSITKSTLHYYDYHDPTMNMNAYGQAEPPNYNLTRITLESISFWVGNTDGVVSEEDTDFTMSQMSVPVERYNIGGSGVLWNHLGFLLHREVSRLLIVPNLKTLAG